MSRIEIKRVPLLGKLVVKSGTVETRVRDVPIFEMFHQDRVLAEKHAPNDIDDQDDFLLHQMTALPLDVIGMLSLTDSENLLIELNSLCGLNNPAPLDAVIAPGYQYTLTRPLLTPMGTVNTLLLRELTRGDQRRAAQVAALATERDGVLIGAMASLQLEDVANLALADSYALCRFFRRIVDTGIADAGNGSGPAADTPGLEFGLPVPAHP
jgi:hypothetical protein